MTAKLPNERKFKWFSSPITYKIEKGKDGEEDFVTLGYFTSDEQDEVGDIITREATTRAIKKYRQWGNVRFMHLPEPVGKVTAIGEDDSLEWNQVKIRVVDDKTKKLIRENILQALSVGIIIKNFEQMEENDGEELGAKRDKFFFFGPCRITDYDMVEMSYVDHPANYDARITEHPKGMAVPIFKAMGIEKDEDSTHTQTVICSKERFESVEDARKWVEEHDYKADKVDETEDSYRFRQFDPDDCKDDSFRTIELTDGVKAVICHLKQEDAMTEDVKKGDEVGGPEVLGDTDNMTNVTEPEEPKFDEFEEGIDEKARWTTAAKNNAKDLVFAVCEPTGEKDEVGRTIPKNARHLPHHDLGADDHNDGNVDLPHYRNALARQNQIKPVTDKISTEELRSKASNHLEKHRSVLEDSLKVDVELLLNDVVWKSFLTEYVESTIDNWLKYQTTIQAQYDDEDTEGDNGMMDMLTGMDTKMDEMLALLKEIHEQGKGMVDTDGLIKGFESALDTQFKILTDTIDATLTKDETPVEPVAETAREAVDVSKLLAEMEGRLEAKLRAYVEELRKPVARRAALPVESTEPEPAKAKTGPLSLEAYLAMTQEERKSNFVRLGAEDKRKALRAVLQQISPIK